MIELPRRVLAALRRHAEAAYPEECCGLLVGRLGAGGHARVSRAEPSANLSAAPRHRFEVDPALYLALERTLAGAERLIGLYHSHPEGGAMPSATDAAAAWHAGWFWLIVPVAEGRAGAVAAHRLVAPGGPFEAVELAATP